MKRSSINVGDKVYWDSESFVGVRSGVVNWIQPHGNSYKVGLTEGWLWRGHILDLDKLKKRYQEIKPFDRTYKYQDLKKHSVVRFLEWITRRYIEVPHL